jgi:outer membrane protein TolC
VRRKISDLRIAIYALCSVLVSVCPARAEARSANVHPIDLPAALKLAGAQNIDVQIARERFAEAKANHTSALLQFFPWIAPGITYRQHDGRIQDVAGNILEVHKHSYAPGATVGLQLDIGDALYRSLAAKQLTHAASHALEAQRHESVLAAAQGYFDLAFAQSAVSVAQEAVRISSSYHTQIVSAVDAGVAFRGDALRAGVQAERNQLAVQQALEQRRLAAARLAQVLRLDSAVELAPQDGDVAPLTLIAPDTALHSIVQQSLAARPELRQSESLISAARETRDGARFGPLIPALGAQAFWGGLGGGRRGVSDSFGWQEDYVVGLSWRVGPGGLFDVGRQRSTDARLKAVELGSEKVQDEITREAVDAFTRWQSSSGQIGIAQRALAAAEEGLRLARERKEFAVGVVLETIQAEQDLTRARLDYLRAVAEFNKAQYALKRAIGDF